MTGQLLVDLTDVLASLFSIYYRVSTKRYDNRGCLALVCNTAGKPNGFVQALVLCDRCPSTGRYRRADCAVFLLLENLCKLPRTVLEHTVTTLLDDRICVDGGHYPC